MIREGHFKLFGTNPFEPSLDETDRVAAAIEAKLDKNKEARDAAAADEAEKGAKLRLKQAKGEEPVVKQQPVIKEELPPAPEIARTQEFELEGGSQGKGDSQEAKQEVKKHMPVLDMAAEFLNAVPASKKDHGIDKPDKNATDEAVRDEAERMAATGNLNATTAEISHQ